MENLKLLINEKTLKGVSNSSDVELFVEFLYLSSVEWAINRNIFVFFDPAAASGQVRSMIDLKKFLLVAEISDSQKRAIGEVEVPIIVTNTVYNAEGQPSRFSQRAMFAPVGYILMYTPAYLPEAKVIDGSWKNFISPMSRKTPFALALEPLFASQYKRYRKPAQYAEDSVKTFILEEVAHAIDHFNLEGRLGRRVVNASNDTLVDYERVVLQEQSLWQYVIDHQDEIRWPRLVTREILQRVAVEMHAQTKLGVHAKNPAFLMSSWLVKILEPDSGIPHYTAYYGLFLAAFYDSITNKGKKQLQQRPALKEFQAWIQKMTGPSGNLVGILKKYVNQPKQFQKALRTMYQYEFAGDLNEMGKDVPIAKSELRSDSFLPADRQEPSALSSQPSALLSDRLLLNKKGVAMQTLPLAELDLLVREGLVADDAGEVARHKRDAFFFAAQHWSNVRFFIYGSEKNLHPETKAVLADFRALKNVKVTDDSLGQILEMYQRPGIRSVDLSREGKTAKKETELNLLLAEETREYAFVKLRDQPSDVLLGLHYALFGEGDGIAVLDGEVVDLEGTLSDELQQLITTDLHVKYSA